MTNKRFYLDYRAVDDIEIIDFVEDRAYPICINNIDKNDLVDITNLMNQLEKENEQLKQEVQELKQVNNQLLTSLKKGIFLPIQPEIKPPVLGPVGRCSIEPIEIKKEDAQEVVKKALEGIK